MSGPQPSIILNGCEYVLAEKPASEAATTPSGGMFADYPELMKPKHVAQAFGLTSQRINQLCREGKIPSVQVSERRRVIPKSALQRWIENRGYRA